VQSIAITAATLIGFVIGLNRVGSVEEARTIAYMVLVLSELIRAFLLAPSKVMFSRWAVL